MRPRDAQPLDYSFLEWKSVSITELSENENYIRKGEKDMIGFFRGFGCEICHDFHVGKKNPVVIHIGLA